tara:strand:- start:899 stop:2065 length:1167 start_codon:yes stop_codon:yes gene_type:complete
MKAKTIKKVLKAKVESLASYVEEFTTPYEDRSWNPLFDLQALKEEGGDAFSCPDRPFWPDAELADDIRKNTIITGGCIISMLEGQDPNDYDCYFRTRDVAYRVSSFFLWLFAEQSGEPIIEADGQSCGSKYLEINDRRQFCPNPKNAGESPGEGRFKVVIRSSGIASTQGGDQDPVYFEQRDDSVGENYVEALTNTDEVRADMIEDILDHKGKGKHHPKFMSSNAITVAGKVQLITRFFGEPDEIHGNYDFIHCTCSYTSWDNKLSLPQAALEALITKELRYVGSLYPLCSIIRIRKFVARGWSINAGQILKMCYQLNEMDLRSIATLEDQLTGVDAAYFCQIIERLTEKQDKERAEMVEKGSTQAEAEAALCKIDGSYLMTIIDRLF